MVVQIPESAAVELVGPDVKLLPKLATMRISSDQTSSSSLAEPDIHHLNNKVCLCTTSFNIDLNHHIV
jgi:hypothetical protein